MYSTLFPHPLMHLKCKYMFLEVTVIGKGESLPTEAVDRILTAMERLRFDAGSIHYSSVRVDSWARECILDTHPAEGVETMAPHPMQNPTGVDQPGNSFSSNSGWTQGQMTGANGTSGGKGLCSQVIHQNYTMMADQVLFDRHGHHPEILRVNTLLQETMPGCPRYGGKYFKKYRLFRKTMCTYP